jgi:hypothetical protein
MNRIDFFLWTVENNIPKKLYIDNMCRLEQIERSIDGCDLEEEYYKDRCQNILSLFKNLGRNEKMANVHIGNLPIGKTYISSYTSAIRKYVLSMDFTINKTNQKSKME